MLTARSLPSVEACDNTTVPDLSGNVIVLSAVGSATAIVVSKLFATAPSSISALAPCISPVRLVAPDTFVAPDRFVVPVIFVVVLPRLVAVVPTVRLFPVIPVAPWMLTASAAAFPMLTVLLLILVVVPSDTVSTVPVTAV